MQKDTHTGYRERGDIIRMEKEHTCECCKKKERSEKERKDMINRLSRIEGQIRGIKGMVEKKTVTARISSHR